MLRFARFIPFLPFALVFALFLVFFTRSSTTQSVSSIEDKLNVQFSEIVSTIQKEGTNWQQNNFQTTDWIKDVEEVYQVNLVITQKDSLTYWSENCPEMLIQNEWNEGFSNSQNKDSTIILMNSI